MPAHSEVLSNPYHEICQRVDVGPVKREATACVLPGYDADDLGMGIAISPGELLARSRSDRALLGLRPELDIALSSPAHTQGMSTTNPLHRV